MLLSGNISRKRTLIRSLEQNENFDLTVSKPIKFQRELHSLFVNIWSIEVWLLLVESDLLVLSITMVDSSVFFKFWKWLSNDYGLLIGHDQYVFCLSYDSIMLICSYSTYQHLCNTTYNMELFQLWLVQSMLNKEGFQPTF